MVMDKGLQANFKKTCLRDNLGQAVWLITISRKLSEGKQLIK